MRYAVAMVLAGLLGGLLGCTPANQPPAGEAVGVRSTPPEPLPSDKPAAVSTTASREISWFTDFSRAKEQALKLDRPILVDFTAEWCGWCKKLDQEVWPDPKVVAAAQPFICVKVDGDANPQLVKNFKVSGYPTVMAVSADGKVLGKAVGYQQVEAMERFLKNSR